eukprot:394157-Prymnesium_polylepis.3
MWSEHQSLRFGVLHNVAPDGRPMLIADRTHELWYYKHGSTRSSHFAASYVHSHFAITPMVGRAGGGFVFDTNALHRGMHEGNATRMTLVLEFHSHDKIGHLKALGFDGPCSSVRGPKRHHGVAVDDADWCAWLRALPNRGRGFKGIGTQNKIEHLSVGPVLEPQHRRLVQHIAALEYRTTVKAGAPSIPVGREVGSGSIGTQVRSNGGMPRAGQSCRMRCHTHEAPLLLNEQRCGPLMTGTMLRDVLSPCPFRY